MAILISKLTFIKKKWGNYEKLQQIADKWKEILLWEIQISDFAAVWGEMSWDRFVKCLYLSTREIPKCS